MLEEFYFPVCLDREICCDTIPSHHLWLRTVATLAQWHFSPLLICQEKMKNELSLTDAYL